MIIKKNGELINVPNSECKKEEYKGDCCCECISNLKMKQHPWHPHTQVKYVCAVYNDIDNTKMCQPNHQHGICEMFKQKGANMQMDMNVDKKLVIVYGKYDGEIISKIGTDIYRVKYE